VDRGVADLATGKVLDYEIEEAPALFPD